MLVLLIIFIITIPTQTHAVKIDNPLPDLSPPARPEVIDLSIDFDGTLLWNKVPVERPTLQNYISQEATKSPQPEVQITVDKFAKYEIVAQTLADFIPGIRPTLFHNNHTWTGQNSLAHLFQGTGALAILLVAIVCALLPRRFSASSCSVRLFLIWMTYNGFLQSLPQIVIGSVESENDVGMAMDYLHLEAPAKAVGAVVALIAIAVAALWLRRPLLGLADSPADVASSRARTIFMFRVATLPAMAAIFLIIPFRVPREFTEVVMVPLIVTVIGIAWLQASAWATGNVKVSGRSSEVPSRYAICGLVMLLLIFQCLLRPGIRFY